MFVRILAYLVLAQFFPCGVFLREPVCGQGPSSDLPTNAVGTTESTRPSETSSSVDLDIYLQGPDNVSVKEPAALTLVTAAGLLYRQGTTKNGHLRWNEVAPMRYGIQVVAPGFERAVQQIDAQGMGEHRVTIQLRPQASTDKAYPPVSSDPEVNYVFGVYASRLGDWEQAKTYWTIVLQFLPDDVTTMLSMSEALLNENKSSEAAEYLDRATKIDPTNWRVQAVLAEISMKKGLASEAVQHAERAIELGHGESDSVSPLLARALMAEADQVLQVYVDSHPGDLAAKKQLESMRATSGPHELESPTGSAKERSAAAVAGGEKSTAAPRGSSWVPPDVDDNVPPVEPGSVCNLEEVLQQAGRKIQEFVEEVQRFTATESLRHESINKSGEVSSKEIREYDYMVSIEELRPGNLGVDEYLSGHTGSFDPPGGMATKGLPALVLIFHPYYSGNYSMSCEGLATLDGKRAWQVYFRQRKDKPDTIRSYRIGLNGQSHPVALKGRAWFLADSYQIVGLQADMIDTIPDIHLTVDHTAVEYGPVHFSSRGVDMWLPQMAEMYCDLRGKRIHQRMSFSNYLLFAVDDKQKILPPKTNP